MRCYDSFDYTTRCIMLEFHKPHKYNDECLPDKWYSQPKRQLRMINPGHIEHKAMNIYKQANTQHRKLKKMSQSRCSRRVSSSCFWWDLHFVQTQIWFSLWIPVYRLWHFIVLHITSRLYTKLSKTFRIESYFNYWNRKNINVYASFPIKV